MTTPRILIESLLGCVLSLACAKASDTTKGTPGVRPGDSSDEADASNGTSSDGGVVPETTESGTSEAPSTQSDTESLSVNDAGGLTTFSGSDDSSTTSVQDSGTVATEAGLTDADTNPSEAGGDASVPNQCNDVRLGERSVSTVLQVGAISYELDGTEIGDEGTPPAVGLGGVDDLPGTYELASQLGYAEELPPSGDGGADGNCLTGLYFALELRAQQSIRLVPLDDEHFRFESVVRYSDSSLGMERMTHGLRVVEPTHLESINGPPNCDYDKSDDAEGLLVDYENERPVSQSSFTATADALTLISTVVGPDSSVCALMLTYERRSWP